MSKMKNFILNKEWICKKCGCTNEKACPEGCYWVSDSLCSRCDMEMKN